MKILARLTVSVGREKLDAAPTTMHAKETWNALVTSVQHLQQMPRMDYKRVRKVETQAEAMETLTSKLGQEKSMTSMVNVT